MVKRIITSVIALPIFLAIIFTGGLPLQLLCLALSLVGLYEFYKVLDQHYRPIKSLGYCLSLLLFIGVLYTFSVDYFFAMIFFSTIILLIINVFSTDNRLNDIAMTLLGVFYITLGFIHLMLFETIDNSFLIFIPFLISWGTDTFAYFSGMLLGKHKLIERVSPKKTIEGAIGGIIGSVIITLIFGYYFAREMIFILGIISFFGSMLSQLGDLIASRIKRITQVKDFGYVLPGHGGILDRFDSILVIIPFVYYFLNLYIGIR
jgi:phosphatidate cytidylyltransferase